MSERKLPELFGSRVFNEETMMSACPTPAIRLGSAVSLTVRRWSWPLPMKLPVP